MRVDVRKSLIVIAAFCLVVSAGQPAFAEESWKELKADAKKAKIDETAKQALEEVFEGSKNAKELYGKAYG